MQPQGTQSIDNINDEFRFKIGLCKWIQTYDCEAVVFWLEPFCLTPEFILLPVLFQAAFSHSILPI